MSLTLQIEGLSCAGCVGRAERALAAVPGVTGASVNLATGRAQVEGEAEAAALAAALDGAGYPARTAAATLRVEGMNCASCTGRVEGALAAQPGVLEAAANLAAGTTRVRWIAGATTPQALAQAVTRAGYPAEPSEASAPAARADRAEETAALGRRALLALALTLPVFVIEMGGHFIPGVHRFVGATLGHGASWWLQFVLVTAVLAGPGRGFFAKGIPALLRGAPEMNSLVALGTLSAWGYSTLALLAPGLFPEGTRAVYFEAAAVICTLILLGRWMEARAKGRAGAAIARLAGLAPRTALRLVDGRPEEVPLDAVQAGDLLEIRPGARIPVDGETVEGRSHVDESMVTGEPVPVLKTEGAGLTGGTVNGPGALVMRATAVGEGTLLAQIIRMVEEAQGGKLPIQALVDRVTAVFVPVVLAVALVTVAVWAWLGPSLALVAGVSVLIVACPCAMGLATPVSIMVGTGRAAELGVLFRRGDALQALQGARVVAFDKTGTLTLGRPELTALDTAPGVAREEALRLAAAVEARSEHPIARAILRAAEAEGVAVPPAERFETVTGMGARAIVDGRDVIVGADRFLAAEGVDLGPVGAAGARIAEAGRTPLYLAADGVALAAIGVDDPIKPEAPAALAALRGLGLHTVLVTGDNAASARAVADRLGLDAVVAEVLPGGKVDAIRALRDAHGPVAFVGDGINDAPALAEADVGLAIGTGTDIAIEAAEVVLISGDPGAVVRALEISRATLRNIRQNLFWAFAYNAALIPVAAGVLYPVAGVLLSPMLAAGAMALSSIFVLGNALRLRRVGAAPAMRPAAPGAPRAQPAE
ncbi:heavy metal translocating P-type ATPase [Jannaschia ovalis]|uniref:Heavy metal translocating P-type ATPase n=1 Tax=Jannaschia ovalis TaxID=3038773 RepID=A0ABY8LFQ1_9RHOB|nr:heavy metal translocating P-type ATPase [Jannaschia sp. GRR-S6-38]WGH79966.1 heavy metal translocating P-type ATPase [Jannaschia sp. GRR-S6-38]